ncbi:MAG: hypothetical protein LBH13_00435 [Cellulomonadaceae bacterium]|nr:hypothetical protein [Cellulomonadaceae bacterium]
MPTTTIKVPTALRDRITAGARERDLPVWRYLESVLEAEGKRQMVAQLTDAMRRNPPGGEYWDEFAALDAIGGGLDHG